MICKNKLFLSAGNLKKKKKALFYNNLLFRVFCVLFFFTKLNSLIIDVLIRFVREARGQKGPHVRLTRMHVFVQFNVLYTYLHLKVTAF